MPNVTVRREDELESSFGGAFKLVRHSLGLSAFGVQILQMPSNAEGYPEHDHSSDGQEELYAVLDGSAKLVADGESYELEPGIYARVGAGQNRTLEPGDHVLMMARRDSMKSAYEWLGLSTKPAEKAIILGGTRLALLTAELLASHGIHTTLIDSDMDRCRVIAESLQDVVTVCGEPKDPKVLRSEGIESTDVVMALSGWDSENVVGALVAKALGAHEVIARFSNTDLVGLLSGIGIDATVSSRLSAANEILRFVRRGVIHSVVTFSDSDAEAIELEIGPNSPAIGVTLADLKLPHSLIIGGVQRGSEAFVPRGNTKIEAGDHLIMIALPEALATAEKLSG
jgi:trk system potassium uptake protein TrkA